MTRRKALTLIGAIFFAGLLYFSPSFVVMNNHEVTYYVPGPEPIVQKFTPPLVFSGKTDFKVEFDLTRPPWASTRFQFIPDDCIKEIKVNGKAVADAALPFCDYVIGRELSLAPYLHSGANHIEVIAINKGGPGGLKVIPKFDRRADISRILLSLFGLTGLLTWAYARYTPPGGGRSTRPKAE